MPIGDETVELVEIAGGQAAASVRAEPGAEQQQINVGAMPFLERQARRADSVAAILGEK